MDPSSNSQYWVSDAGPSASISSIQADDSSSISTRRSIPDSGAKIAGRHKKSRIRQDESRNLRKRDFSESEMSGMSLSELPRPTVAEKTIPIPAHEATHTSKPLKKIRLIVREPPPSFSSPRQRPEPKRFNGSLDLYLKSWTEIDGKICDEEELQMKAQHNARILEKAEALRKKGRLPEYGLDHSDYRGPTLSRHRFGFSGHLAGNVASKLKGNWETQMVLREREELREIEAEKQRLRSLAWNTLLSVVEEWKEVVRYVREEKRLEIEAEEKRRGVLHLDAILDQSGQILERQQLEMGRTGSASLHESEDGDDDDDEEEDEDEEEGEISDEEEEHFGREFSEATNVEGKDDASMNTDASTESEEDEDIHVGSSALIQTLGSDSIANKTVLLNGPADADHEMQDSSDSRDESTPRDYVISSPEAMPDRDDVEIIIGHNDVSPDSVPSPAPEKSCLVKTEFVHSLGSLEGYETHKQPLQQELNVPPVVIPNGVFKDVPSSPSTVFDSEVSQRLINGFTYKYSALVDKEADASTDDPTTDILSNGDSPVLDSNIFQHNQLQKRQELESNIDTELASTSGEETNKTASIEVLKNGEHTGTRSEDALRDDDSRQDDISQSEWDPPEELQAYAVAHVIQNPDSKIAPPLLLRGTLRPYQQSGLEWLVTQYKTQSNGILADEMGLGKTIQTIALLAHLACDWGIWGPHLIIVPTSVLLNWEMEFKKFLPGFKVLSYHGSTKRRKELRQGWNNKHAFNVCVTSYTLASKDQHIFRRKAWFYMVLDEAHMIKNYKSQRWNILLNFKSFRRLLLTGTPLQNNLIELWALLKFLVSGTEFANQKEFKDWFSGPLERAIEQGTVQDQEVQAQVTKLHSLLRPRLLRRLKRDVEKELPSKYEHLVLCRLSKRQRYLYDEFMSRAQTREDLKSGVYQKIANILMQLRKVCNHPDLFEVRPIVTSFAMEKSAIADYEIKELLVRRKLLNAKDESSHVNLEVMNLRFTHLCNTSLVAAQQVRSLEESLAAEIIAASPGEPPPRDLQTIEGFRKYDTYRQRLETATRYQQFSYLNRMRCQRLPLYGLETLGIVRQLHVPIVTGIRSFSIRPKLEPLSKTYDHRASELASIIDKFAFATPSVVARDLPALALKGIPDRLLESCSPEFDSILHRAAVKLQIAFPDASLLQYDCGKLQELSRLLRERKSGGHRVLIFTQMTRILDILEIFLNYHGYLYLRLDGATKIEDRQYITERFNVDTRIFVFIASSRSGGVGINLTGADTVIFYDSDFNPQMDRQCEDRAHRIGQIRDVHIYRFISQHTVEEAMLRKANQKRSLDDLVIQQGEFDWKNFFRSNEDGGTTATTALQKALVEFEDFEDSRAAKIAASEEAALNDEDLAEFGGDVQVPAQKEMGLRAVSEVATPVDDGRTGEDEEDEEEEEEEEGGHWRDYMLRFVRRDFDFFREWKV